MTRNLLGVCACHQPPASDLPLSAWHVQPDSYALYRPDFFAAAFSAAKAADAKAMMPWELVAWHVAPTDSGGFDFGPDDVSYIPVASAIASQHSKVGGLGADACMRLCLSRCSGCTRVISAGVVTSLPRNEHAS